MKQSKTARNPGKKRRILFFDVLRIVFIAIIVYAHSQFFLIPGFNSLFFPNGQNFFNLYVNGITGLAVYGVIFISGAVLEYSYRDIRTMAEYKVFLFKRFIRLYPAFWMSLLLGLLVLLIVTPLVLLQANPLGLLFEFTGFFVVLGQGPGKINSMGWFIGTIVCLYILFPWLSRFIKKYRISAILLLMAISYVSRYLLYTNSIYSLDLMWRWIPLCNLFEFGLGIYIVQQKFYPVQSKDYPLISRLADLSFYVFLFHVVVINSILPLLPNTGIAITGTVCYFSMMAMVLLVSWIVMVLDGRVQRMVRRNETVKRLLNE